MTRSELFEAIWAAPMVDVSKSVGVSDTALAAICKRENIPRPYRGFWRQRSTGHAPAIPQLPQPEIDPVIDELTVNARATHLFAVKPMSPIPNTKATEGPDTKQSPVLALPSSIDGAAEYQLLVGQVHRYQAITQLLDEVERHITSETASVHALGLQWLKSVGAAHAAAKPIDQMMFRLKTLAAIRN